MNCFLTLVLYKMKLHVRVFDIYSKTFQPALTCIAELNMKLDQERKQVIQEMSVEREHHQRLVKEHGRLQQRMENLLEERNAKSMHALTRASNSSKANMVEYDTCEQVAAQSWRARALHVVLYGLCGLVASNVTNWVVFIFSPSNVHPPFRVKLDFKMKFRFAN